MKPGTFDTLLSFLLGFAWAMLFIGAWFVFKTTVVFGFAFAFLSTLFFIFFVLFCILLLEGLHLYKERNEMVREQTRLLRRIAEKLDKEG